MTRAAAFTAEIVRASSRGLAGIAAAALYERLGALADPSGDGGGQPSGSRTNEAETRYGADGFELWKQTMSARLLALASALEVGDAQLFADDIEWFRGLSTSRSIPAADVVHALECLEETVVAQLPENGKEVLQPYFEAARRTLDGDDDWPEELAAGSAANELFDVALLGDLRGARELLRGGVESGRFTFEQAIVDVLLPASREAGRRWHLGRMGIATEHIVTATLRMALHSLPAALPDPVPHGKAAFIAAVPGDIHDTGLIAFALLLENDGWRVALAGADTPTDEVDPTAEAYDCDLIALSATLAAQRYALSTYLGRRTATLPVLVGGAAVRGEKDALAMGASGYSSTLGEGLREARRIVGLPTR